MFGIRFIKADPSTYVLQFKRGEVVREGAGLSFFYYSPTTSLVTVPMASVDVPFIFEEVTADFQEVTVQGQVAYRIREPRKLAALLNFTLTPDKRRYISDDPEKLPRRIIDQVQVLMRAELQKTGLREALKRSENIVTAVREGLGESDIADQLGIEVIALSVLALKPNPETARALEAEVREQLLLSADEAIYQRRNAAVEQERAIKENELNTAVAVENKKREIQEAKLDADRVVQEKRQAMSQAEMSGNVTLEEKKRELVTLAVENQKAEADAKAYDMEATMGVVRTVDPKALQALANMGMDPARLIAGAFQNLADNAGRIGNLNIAPELLSELLEAGRTER